MKKFALVLGGGAAKGFAHVGVLKVLEEHNLKPDLIVGTSMGAVVGGIYAKGTKMEEIEKIASKFTMSKISDISLSSMLYKGHAMRGKKVKKVIYNLVGSVKHSKLKIPFVAVATELSTGKQVNLSDGYVYQSILASSAMPAVFPSIEIEGKKLYDGGIKDNLPVDVAKKLEPKAVVLSVDVIGDYDKQYESGGLKLMTEILNMSTLYMSQLKNHKGSDINIKINQPDVKQMDFNPKSAKLAIENGEKAMKRYINKLLKLLED